MTVPGNGYMRASDAFSWYMERDPALRSTVVAAIWLDRPPDWDVLVARVDRISRSVPSLRQRVVESLFRLTAPRWTYDPHFDLSWRLRRVRAPSPRTRVAVLELARQSAMDAFDRDRPLWELTLVEGIKGGRAALILKMHHSLSDGVGGMQMLTLLCDLQRDPPDLGEMPPAPPGETMDSFLCRLTEQGARTIDPATRRAIYARVQELAAADLPYVSLWWHDTVAVMNRRVDGFDPYPNGSLRSLATLTLRAPGGGEAAE